MSVHYDTNYGCSICLSVLLLSGHIGGAMCSTCTCPAGHVDRFQTGDPWDIQAYEEALGMHCGGCTPCDAESYINARTGACTTARARGGLSLFTVLALITRVCGLRMLMPGMVKTARTTECDWDGVDSTGRGLGGGGSHSIDACLRDCLMSTNCNFAALMGSYCHLFATCDGVGAAADGWTFYENSAQYSVAGATECISCTAGLSSNAGATGSSYHSTHF
jgi:hypothetical protein